MARSDTGQGFLEEPDIYSTAEPRLLLQDGPCRSSGLKSRGRLLEPPCKPGQGWGLPLSHSVRSRNEIQSWLFPLVRRGSAKPLGKHTSTSIPQLCVREGSHGELHDGMAHSRCSWHGLEQQPPAGVLRPGTTAVWGWRQLSPGAVCALGGVSRTPGPFLVQPGPDPARVCTDNQTCPGTLAGEHREPNRPH